MGIKLPNFMDTAMTCMIFVWAGYFVRQHQFLSLLHQHSSIIVGLALLIISAIMIAHLKLDFVYVENEYRSNLLVLHLLSATGILGILIICARIGRIPAINYIGKNSILLLGTHQAIMTALIFLFGFIEWGTYNLHWLKVDLIFFLTLTISILLIPIWKKWFPRFTAQKELIK